MYFLYALDRGKQSTKITMFCTQIRFFSSLVSTSPHAKHEPMPEPGKKSIGRKGQWAYMCFGAEVSRILFLLFSNAMHKHMPE